MTLKRMLQQDRWQVMSLFASSIKPKPKYIFAEWGYLVLWRPQYVSIKLSAVFSFRPVHHLLLNWHEITSILCYVIHLPLTGEPIFIVLQQIIREARIESSKTELSQPLKRAALEKGFAISDNQGEGNCMFFALSEQLDLIKGIKISHDELRRTIVQHLQENPKLVSTLFFLLFLEWTYLQYTRGHNSKQFNSKHPYPAFSLTRVTDTSLKPPKPTPPL